MIRKKPFFVAGGLVYQNCWLYRYQWGYPVHPTSKHALSVSRGQTCMTPFENGQGKTGGMCTEEKHVHIKIQKGRFIFFFIINFSLTRLISFRSGSLTSLKKENQTKILKDM